MGTLNTNKLLVRVKRVFAATRCFCFLIAMVAVLAGSLQVQGADYSASRRAGPDSKDSLRKHFEEKVRTLCLQLGGQAIDEDEDEGEQPNPMAGLRALGIKVIPVLHKLVREGDGVTQLGAAAALVEMKAPGVVDLLITVAEKKGPVFHDAFIGLIADLNDPRAIELFCKWIPRAAPDKKTELYYYLTYYNERLAFEVLRDGYFGGNDEIRRYSYTCLKRLLDRYSGISPKADKAWDKKLNALTGRLQKDIRKSREEKKLGRAIRDIGLLGLSRRKSAAGFLKSLMEDESPTVRAATVSAMGNMGKLGAKYCGNVVDALGDKQLTVRIRAIEKRP